MSTSRHRLRSRGRESETINFDEESIAAWKTKKIIHDNDKVNQFKFEALYDEENLFDEELMKLKKEMKLIDELINGRYNPLGNEKQVGDEDNIAMEVLEDMNGVEDEKFVEVPEQSKVVEDNLEEKLVDKIFARWSLEDIRYYQQWLSLQENIDLISFSMLTDEYIEWDCDIPHYYILRLRLQPKV